MCSGFMSPGKFWIPTVPIDVTHEDEQKVTTKEEPLSRGTMNRVY